MDQRFTLILNSTNVIGNYNSQYKYNFLNGGFNVSENSAIAVSQVILPYSWFNISQSVYGNATFSYIWYYGAGLARTYTVILPDGNYSTIDINNYLEQYFISQNQYFTNASTGMNLYYIKLVSNATYYTNQFLFSPLPSSLPTGYTAPSAGFNYNNSTNYGYSSVGYTPRIQITSTPFGSLIGYTIGTYPSTLQFVSYSQLGNTIPNINPVNSLVLTCDIVSNQCTTPSNILDSFSLQNTGFGSNILYSPSYEKFITISPGNFPNLTLSLYDQNFNLIKCNDINIMIQLVVKLGKFNIPKPYKELNPIKKLFSDVEEEKNISI
jgi:hypothetical protein